MEEQHDTKKMPEKANKAMRPSENKTAIRFRHGRSAEGIIPDADGVAHVSEATAQYLVSIGYADYVK